MTMALFSPFLTELSILLLISFQINPVILW